MALDILWGEFVRPWGSNNFSGDWTVDVELAPSTALAYAEMSAFYNVFIAQDDYGFGSSVYSGVRSYTTRDPDTNADIPHDVGTGQRNSVVPAIFDSNVDSITFAWGLWVVLTLCQADITFLVMVEE